MKPQTGFSDGSRGVKKRKIKPAVFFALYLYFIAAFCLLIAGAYTRNMVKENIEENFFITHQYLKILAEKLPEIANGDDLKQFSREEDTAKPEYMAIKKRLAEFADQYRLTYAYFSKETGDGEHFYHIIDNVLDPNEWDSFKNIYKKNAFSEKVFSGKPYETHLGEYDSNWPGYLSAFFPLFDSDGTLYCVAGVDIVDGFFMSQVNDLQRLAAVQIAALIIGVGAGVANMLIYRRQARKNESANREKSLFLARMSHEIRTPMNTIIGMSDLMPADNLSAVQVNYFDNIKRMAKSLLGIINDILDFSKIEAGKMNITPVHYNIHVLFDNVSSMFHFIAAGKSLEFQSVCDEGVPEILFGDEGRVRQIFTNIVNNAIKYSHHGFVRFSLKTGKREGGEYLIAQVADSGIGIKKEDFSKLFNSFQRFDEPANRNTAGTGLGLALTKYLLTLMGGFIEVESEYGKGSSFTVYIPLVLGDSAKMEERSGKRARVVGSGDALVLVVDDIPVNLTVAAGFLAAHKISADTAGSGAEALEMVQKKDYDIVFMDHMMPGMDGIEATQRIRSLKDGQYKKMPIIALSANVAGGAVESFFEAGMNDFIPKPIEDDRLNAALAKWMPPDKIKVIETGKTPDAPVEDSADSLFIRLGQVEGLDTAEGLFHIGGRKLEYYKALRQFCADADETVRLIRKDAQSENWKDFATRVHGVKGLMRTIGQKRLGEWAYKLECAGGEGNISVCSEDTEGFCADILLFRDKLTQIGLLERSVKRKKIAESALREIFSALSEACRNFDADQMEELAEKLSEVSFSAETDAELDELCALASSFEYEKTVEKIKLFKFSV